jgi:hypothetical protein
MPKRPPSISVRVLLSRDDNRWVAHCLEFDLLGDGSTKVEAIRQLWQAIGIQVEESKRLNNRANLFNPAPPIYWERFARGREVRPGDNFEVPAHFDSDLEIPTEDFREYAESDSDPDLVRA